MISPILLSALTLLSGNPGTPALAADEWPQWRGPLSSGVAAGPAPIQWSEEEGIRWKVELPGEGSSTPVVWGDHIILTAAVNTELTPDGEKPATEPEPEGGRRGGERGGRGGRGGRGRSAAPTSVHEFLVMALDRESGKEIWRTTVAETVPHESGHSTNTQASASPVTDGEHIYAFFGSRGLHCLDMEGKPVWSKELGQMQTRNQFGEGASPALHGDTLVIVWDHEGDDFIAAFDKKTGEERWRKERDEPTTWVTPLIVPVGDRHQVIVPATGASRAYDLKTGEVVWSLAGMTTNCIPTPMYEDGVVYMMSGYRGSALQAIKLEGAKGDLTDSEHLLWSHRKGTSYVPSGVLVDGMIYFLRTNTGVLSAVKSGDGASVYEGERLGDIRAVYASITAAGDYLYIPSREGLTAVVKRGPEFELVALNALDGVFDASPVIVDGELLLRGTNSLYCVGAAQ